MLRISGGKPSVPAEEELPVEETTAEEPMPEEASDVPTEPSETDGGPLDPALAGYKGPEMGPFACGNCMYFSPSSPNTCVFVAGFIDEGGVCNLFTSGKNTDPNKSMPEGEPMPEEAPAAEPPTELPAE